MLFIRASLPAQSVRGVLQEEQTGRPIAASFVALLDETGTDLAKALSDSAGRFLLRAPGAGRYHLRADRIGYESTLSPSFELSAGEAMNYRMGVRLDPVRLEALSVEGESRCRQRPGDSRATYALWQQVRKALEAARWTERRRPYAFDVVVYHRTLDARGKRTLAERADTLRMTSRMPFVSRPAAELSQRGYIREGGDSALYVGPDADVLLSGEFQEAHCFQVEAGKGDRRGRLGLGFHPTGGRKLPDIKGVLWLDRASAELRDLDFGYTGVTRRPGVPAAQGRVEFSRLHTGEWIVPRWWIRTPMVRESGMDMKVVSGGRRRLLAIGKGWPQTVLLGFLEQGAYVTGVHPAHRRRLVVLQLDSVRVRSGERLERARVGFAAGDTAQAARDYWRGCEEVKSDDGGEASGYWLDAAPLVTADERSAWAELWNREPEGAAACGFFRRFWAERANRAGVSVTARLATHYARLRYAREHYARVGGLRDRLGTGDLPLSRRIGRPPEVALDDRGLIYVRMGPPDRRASFGGMVQSPVISPTCYDPNESWAYDYPSGTRVYHFSPLGGVADWWLIDNLRDIYQCGDPDRVVILKPAGTNVDGKPVFKKTFQGVLNPTNGGLAPVIGRIAYLVLPELYESRQGLDLRYARAAHRLRDEFPDTLDGTLKQGMDRSGKILNAREQLATEREWTWADGYFALDSVPDRPAVRPVVELRYEALQFRGRDGRRTRVWLNGVARGKTLQPDTLPDGRLLYRVQVNYSLLNEAGAQSLASRSFQAESDHRLSGDEGIPYRVPVDLKPGSYDYTVLVRDAHDRADLPAGNYGWGTLAVRPLRGDLPELSDVVVAPDSGGSWSPRAGVYLKASPVHATSPSGIAYLYYEAYGLTPGGETETTVSLRPANGKGEPFELRYPGQAQAGEAAWGFLRLDLSRTRPGPYLAKVRVRDVASGVETLPIEVHLSVEHP